MALVVLSVLFPCPLLTQDKPTVTRLPNGKLLGTTAGNPRQVNNLPTAVAISPDRRFVVFLHSGYGAYTSGEKQSLSVLTLATDELRDFPDDRLGSGARQTYFLGLAFSLDGKRLFASMASLTDPLGKQQGSTGNGIAVYAFDDGRITPERFIPLPPRLKIPAGKKRRHEFRDVTYPAGLSVAEIGGQECLLVAANNSDEAVLLSTADGKIVRRFDLSTFKQIPAALPYTTVMTKDGKRAFVSLWNASTVAELDLLAGRVRRMIPLRKPSSPLAGGSHPERRQLAFIRRPHRSRPNRGSGHLKRQTACLSLHQASGSALWRQRSGIARSLFGRKNPLLRQRNFRFCRGLRSHQPFRATITPSGWIHSH